MKQPLSIPFNRPTPRGKEMDYIREVLDSGHLAGNGPFSRRVEGLLEARLGAPKVLLTHSATAALEIAALLTVRLGDEVIMPSFTFAATASAFARCGATPVFVDICADTLNIDPAAATAALTARTRAIVGVHYAGVACDVDALRGIAASAGLAFIEDAAPALGASHRGRPLGAVGDLAAISFHHTKNVVSGEGGALVVNDRKFIGRAETIRDRGTNRAAFLQGEVSAYGWVDLGSAFAPSEVTAAFLLAQVEDVDAITAERLRLWQRYHEAFAAIEQKGLARRPDVPEYAAHNGHIYHLLLADARRRSALLEELNRRGIGATAHYAPLHMSPAGKKFGRTAGSLANSEDVAARLLRLPLYSRMSEREQDAVIDGLVQSLLS